MQTHEVMKAMRTRYKSPEWAFLEQVGNATGGGTSRHADAVAMSLWPSRGIELHGFEVKVSRTDWLKELENPAKAEAICQYCDRWWIVTGSKDIVRTGELPPTWGLIVPGHNGTLVVATQAPELTPKPLTKLFIAALLRRAAEWKPCLEGMKAVREEGYSAGSRQQESETKMAIESYKRLQKKIDDFQEKSGIRIDGYQVGRDIEGLRMLNNAKQTIEWMRDQSENANQHAESLRENLLEILSTLRG